MVSPAARVTAARHYSRLGTKELNTNAVAKSAVVPQQTVQPQQGWDALGENLLLAASNMAAAIRPWGTAASLRDRQLRAFLPQEPFAMSAMATVIARNVGLSWNLDGPPRVVARTQDMLHQAEFGQGWEALATKLGWDYQAQDKGAFAELVRDYDDMRAPVVGLNHLDAGRCWHTGNVQYPVLYSDRIGRWHAMAWYQVIKLAEMPAPHETLYGLQYCSLTRMLSVAQTVMNILKIHEEKSGGRFTSSVKIVSGVRRGEIEGAMTQAQNYSDEQGLLRWQRPAILSTTDPMAEPKMLDLDLATLPADFDFDKNFQWYLTLYAMALLSDYSEFAPLPGKGGIGTASQVEMQHRKGRAKGIAIWTNRVEHAFNFFGVVPQNVTFSYDDKDIEEDQARAEVMLAYSQAYSLMITGAALDAQAVRELLHDAGLIPQDIFDALMERLKLTVGNEISNDIDPTLDPLDNPSLPDNQRAAAAASPADAQNQLAVDNVDSQLGQRQMTQAIDAERVLVEDRLTEEAKVALGKMGKALASRLGDKAVGDRSFSRRVWTGAETTGRKSVSQPLPEVQVTPAQIHVLMPPAPPPAPRLVRTTKHVKRDPETGKIADVVEEQQEI